MNTIRPSLVRLDEEPVSLADIATAIIATGLPAGDLFVVTDIPAVVSEHPGAARSRVA